MQWLVDLVIAAIGIPPTYIDRGDPAAADFTAVDFTDDATWRDFDLSAIVPAGAVAVAFSIRVRNNLTAKIAQFRENGNVVSHNKSWLYTQVAGHYITADMIVYLDSDRKIEYYFSAGNWTSIAITVKGWWL